MDKKWKEMCSLIKLKKKKKNVIADRSVWCKINKTLQHVVFEGNNQRYKSRITPT